MEGMVGRRLFKLILIQLVHIICIFVIFKGQRYSVLTFVNKPNSQLCECTCSYVQVILKARDVMCLQRYVVL